MKAQFAAGWGFDAAQRLPLRPAPLGLIVLLHAGMLYALQPDPARQVAAITPTEVLASFITPEAPPLPAPPKTQTAPPQPAPPKKTAAPLPRVRTSEPSAVEPPRPAPPAEQPGLAPSLPAPSSQPVPAQPAPPKIVSGVEYLNAPPPEYPPLSKRDGEEGTVILRVLVNTQGRPERIDIKQSSGFARLDEAARQAVSRYLFKPYLEDGRPVAVVAPVPIRFTK